MTNSNISIIVEVKNKQILLEKNKFYNIPNLTFKLEKKLFLNKILFINLGKKLFLGTPYLNHVKIKIKVISHFSQPKIITYKMKPKKGIRKKSGFLNKLTRIYVQEIFIK